MPESKKLPDFVLCSLFSNTIVLPQRTRVIKSQFKEKKSNGATKNKAVEAMHVLGKNARNVLILINEQADQIISPEKLEVLLKMVTACKLTLDDISIINLANNPVLFSALNQQYKPLTVLMFDIKAEALGLPFAIPEYQVQHFDQCNFLCASGRTLEKGEGNKEIIAAKKKLWASLQKIFLSK